MAACGRAPTPPWAGCRRHRRSPDTQPGRSTPQDPASGEAFRARQGDPLRRQLHPRLPPQGRRSGQPCPGRRRYPLHPPGRLCCGLTWVSTGQLGTARRIMTRTVTALDNGDTRPIIVAEPSCAAALKRDIPELLGTEAAQRVADRVHTFTGALTDLAHQDCPAPRPTPRPGSAPVRAAVTTRPPKSTRSPSREAGPRPPSPSPRPGAGSQFRSGSNRPSPHAGERRSDPPGRVPNFPFLHRRYRQVLDA
ncbi:heterodisulfide reductase-related iron-sulfur binding cluster [Streptomyces collinus]|uniref:heterodisulfide reductase-related iron-sulfur binding cluster n=1 Tax=Streptomyces collinus TaxID=42684 RepID=UPI0037BB5C63